MKRTAWIFLIFAYLVAATIALGFLARRPFGRYRCGPSAGPLIQDVTTNALTVVWWQDGDGEGFLRLRGSGLADSRCSAVRRGNRYEARAEHLAVGTTYRYEILHTDTDGRQRRLCTGQVATAKPAGTSFSFSVFADSGSGKSHQYRLARVMDAYPADLILHAGDLVYPEGGGADYHTHFFRPYRELLDHVPFYPVLGNHDVRTENGKPFLETFSLPTNGPPSVPAGRCYWFDYGDARFVGVDSNLDRETLAQAVAPWLQSVLSTARAKWKFVYFHHPPWAGGHYPDDAKVRDTLVPVIETAGVDIVFCGHHHLYERTHPIVSGKAATGKAPIYIVSGAGGKSLHREQCGDAPYLAAFNDATYSFTWVNVGGSRLEIMQVGEADDILDEVVLVKDAPIPTRGVKGD